MPSAPVEKYVVFVGNLTWRVRTRHLRELFASTPGVQSVEVIFQTTTPRRSAGYAFVSFSSKEEAEAAISTFNGQVNILKCCIFNIIRTLPVWCSNWSTWKHASARQMLKQHTRAHMHNIGGPISTLNVATHCPAESSCSYVLQINMVYPVNLENYTCVVVNEQPLYHH